MLTENQRTQYTFDALNRMSMVTACANADCSLGDTTTYHYNEIGSLRLVLHANGTTTEYQYDSLNRLTLLTTWDAFGAVIHRQQFHLGAAGHREMLVEDSTRVVEYTYDALYRLVEEKVSDPRGDRTTTYTFDATGNRLSRTTSCDPECHGEIEVGVTTYVYDANDRLLEETSPEGITTYQYDPNGNTLQKSAPDGTVDYTYNAEDRLTQASGALESGITTEYSYDAQGIRQRQTVDGITNRFLVDPTHQYAQVLETLDATANPVATYVIGHERISQTQVGQTHTYHADGLGSIRVLTDDTGTANDTYVYEAFGQQEHTTGTTPNSFRYTGEQYDPNLGFYYLRARYYDPANGRFPTMDTYQGRIHEPQTLHKYLYVHGDPVSNVDPSGYMTLAGQLTGINIGTTLRLTTVSTVRVNTRRLAANDALWATTAGATSVIRSAGIGIATAFALSASSNRRDRFFRTPIIVFGSDFPGHSQHIRDAQTGNVPGQVFAPFALNGYPERDRNWLRTTLECDEAARAKFSIVMACDEYPFASSRQGGRENYNANRVSLRLLDLSESAQTGQFIRRFYNEAAISRDGYSNSSRFIALGIPGIPSFFTDRSGNVRR